MDKHPKYVINFLSFVKTKNLDFSEIISIGAQPFTSGNYLRLLPEDIDKNEMGMLGKFIEKSELYDKNYKVGSIPLMEGETFVKGDFITRNF